MAIQKLRNAMNIFIATLTLLEGRRYKAITSAAAMSVIMICAPNVAAL